MTEYVHLISSSSSVRFVVGFLPESQLERNLQLIKIGKFLFIFRSSRPEYMRIPYIQEEKRANTYETNVAAKKKKKTNDGR